MGRAQCGRSVVVAQEPSKLLGRVRFPSPALQHIRGVAQSGSAPGWGPGGRRFKSCLPDLRKGLLLQAFSAVRGDMLTSNGVQMGSNFLYDFGGEAPPSFLAAPVVDLSWRSPARRRAESTCPEDHASRQRSARMAPDLEFRGQPFLPDDTAGEFIARSLADESMSQFRMAVAWTRFGGVARIEPQLRDGASRTSPLIWCTVNVGHTAARSRSALASSSNQPDEQRRVRA